MILLILKLLGFAWIAAFLFSVLGVVCFLIVGLFGEDEAAQSYNKSIVEALSVIGCITGAGLLLLWAMMGPIR